MINLMIVSISQNNNSDEEKILSLCGQKEPRDKWFLNNGQKLRIIVLL